MEREWTEEEDRQILGLRSRGLSGGEIAAHFGVTRNTICGKLHRLKGRKVLCCQPMPLALPKKPEPVAPSPGLLRPASMSNAMPRPRKLRERKAFAFLHRHIGYAGDDCVLWPFSTKGNGYGQLHHEKATWTASRLMCQLVHGAPPSPKLLAVHSCKNKLCVNPRHLSWQEPASLPKPKKPSAFQVFEVALDHQSIALIGDFSVAWRAQECANEAFGIEGAFRLIYKNNSFAGGVCWKPASNEMWDEATKIADAAVTEHA